MPPLNSELLAKAKGLGFSDRQIAHLPGTTEDAIRTERKKVERKRVSPGYSSIGG
jgi:hypothetical protein